MTTKLERIQNMEEELAALKKEVEEETKPKGRWRSEYGDSYFHMTAGGAVGCYPEYMDIFDDFRYSSGNYFKTAEELTVYKQELLATQRVKDRIAELNAKEGWVADFSGGHLNYSIAYYHDRGKLGSVWSETYQMSPVDLVGSHATIEAVIEEMPEDCKLMLGVV